MLQNDCAALATAACEILCPEDRAWLSPHLAAFLEYSNSYVEQYPADSAHHRLKQEHTLHVLGVAAHIAMSEEALAAPPVRRAVLLAALFHDVGRFEQFRQYHTFADALSVNHGTLGLSVLLKKGFLAEVPRPIRACVHCGVGAHNAFRIPPSVRGAKRDVVQAVRDADKVDILRVMGEHLGPGGTPDSAVVMHLVDAPEQVTPGILAALGERRIPSYKDMRFFNDFRIVICSWVIDLHFPCARALVKRTGGFDPFVEGLGGAPEACQMVREFLQTELEYFHFENALTDDGASLVRANEE